MQKAYTPADLTLVEKTYLGVLATGIVPARLANDPSLRMDYLTAVIVAVLEGGPRETYLIGDGPGVTPEFNARLTEAALALDEKGILSAGSPPPDVLMTPEMARPKPVRTLDFDQHPRIWDRYLGHHCMEELFSNPDVYPFLMGKYQDSGEVWRTLYQQGYGRWR